MTGRRLIVLVCFAEVLSMTGFGVFPGLLPTFFTEWGLSNTEAGWINGIYFAAYMIAVPVLVALTDRVDPRRIYAAAALCATAASVGFGVLAEGFWTAMVFRALAGLGLAGTYMPALKALTDHVDDRLQSRAVAFYTATFSIGASLSYFLAGEFAAWLDWRWAFALSGLGPLAGAALLWARVPPSAPHHLTPPRRSLLDFRPILRNPRAMAYVLAYLFHNWELFALRSWIVTFLVYAQSLQPDGGLGKAWSATTIAALVNMTGLPASVLGNEASRRFGRRRVVVCVMLGSAVYASFLGFLAPVPFVVLVALCFVYNLTVTGESASITAGAVAASAAGERGATMAVHSFIGFSGAFLGPLAFGMVLDLAGDGEALAWGLAFVSSGLAVALGPLAIAVLLRRVPPASPED